MSSLEVDISTFTDADFNLTQAGPFANGLASVGSNPLHMQIRSVATDPTVWADSANGKMTVTPVSGGSSVAVFIPQSILATMPAGTYVYSVVMSLLSGSQRQEVFRGTITHSAGPTQWAAGTP